MRQANRAWALGLLGCAIAVGASFGAHAQASPRPMVLPVGPLNGEGYVALTPARLLDMRVGGSTVDGLQVGAGALGADEVVDLSVLGRGGVPATGVGSVVLHITAVGQTERTFITVYPKGIAWPGTSNLNPVPGIVASNTSIVPIGTDGEVSLFNKSGNVQLIVDVTGWFPEGPRFTAVTPARVADTRVLGTKVGAGQSLPVQVAGIAGVPTSGVSAVVLNVTSVMASTQTFLTVHANGTPLPGTSNLNTQLANTAANLVVTPMGADGKIAVRNEAGTVHVIVDVLGWYAIGAGYTPVTPTRVADTRSTTHLTANSSRDFQLTGLAGVPSAGVGSVIFNLTAVNHTARTYLTAYPTGSPMPLASSLNPHPGIVAPNLVIGKVSPAGSITIYNEQGTVDIILDVVGWLPSNVVASSDSLTVTEDDAATTVDVLANDTDLDGSPLKVQSVSQPDNGTAAVVSGGLSVTYRPDADYCNTPSDPADTFTYTLFGGATATVSATVTCVDDLPPNATPVAQGQTGGAAASTVEDTPVSVTLTATDADDDNLTFSIVAASSDGVLGAIGAVDCATTLNTCTADVVFTPSANFNGSTSFTFKANDSTIDSNTATVEVSVTAVNDAPSFTKGADQSVAEDAGAQSVVGWATAINKGAANESAQTLTFNVTGNTNSGLFAAGPSVSSAGTLTYTPAANANGVATITLTVSDNGGTAGGGVDTSAAQTFTITVTPVNDEPSFTKGADQSVAEDAGAQSVVGWATAINKGAANESAQTLTFNVTGNTNSALFSAGPSIASNGTLSYTPVANANGAATITLTLSDDGGIANSGDDTSASHSFIITVTAVNDVPTSPGRAYGAASLQANMQRSFAAASGLLVGASDAADVAGNAGYTPTLSVGTVNGVAPVSGTITTTIGGVGTVVADAATGAFTIDPAPGVTGAVQFNFTVCDAGDGSPATQCSVTAVATFDIAGPVIWFVDPASGTNGVGTLSSPFNVLSAADAVDAANHRIFVFNGATSSGLTMLSGEWLIGQSSTHASNTFDGLFGLSSVPSGTFVRPTIGSGTTTIGGTVTLNANAKVQGVAINTTTTAGLVGSGPASGISVTETSVTTTTGTAVSLSTAVGTYNLTSVTTNGAANGVLLDTLGISDVTITTGSIVGATSRGIDINSGSGAFSYGGTITTSSTGRSVEITSRTGGTLAFTGSISDSGSGINLSSNAGATMNFSGGVVVSSGTNNAFNATGGGTVSVTSSTNTLTTTSGTALNVVSTTIGASDLTFRSISAGTGAGTPANGIVLNTTGALGELIVTGNGGTCTAANTAGCSGGEIRNTVGGDDAGVSPVGTGIVLRDTKAPSFTRMWVHDNSNYAIRGNTVAGFTLANSVINGVNGTNAASPFRDASVAFDGLTGSASVASSAISGGYADNFRVLNAAGSLDRITFSGVTIGDNNAANGNDAVLLESSGSATLKVTVTGSTFTGAAGDLLQFSHGGAGTGDLVLTGNNFSNNHPGIATGGGGLTLSNEGTSGATTMNIDNNDFRDAVGPGVLIVKGTGNSTQVGTFNNNRIGVAATPNSGSAEGSALKLQTVGGGTQTWAVTNNTIYGYNNYGIEVLAGGSASAQSGNVNTTITGNLIAQPGNTLGTQAISKNGIHLNIGTVTGDTYAACAAIGGAGALANSISTAGLDGVPATGAGDNDFRLRQRQSTTIRLPGYGGAATDTSAVNLYIASQNAGNGAAVGISSVNSPPGGGFTGGASPCA